MNRLLRGMAILAWFAGCSSGSKSPSPPTADAASPKDTHTDDGPSTVEGPRDSGGQPQAGLACPAWPASTGKRVTVAPSEAGTLPGLVRTAAAGTAFVLAPGTYVLTESLQVRAANITLRSSTDRAEDVVLDGGYVVAEAVQIYAANATLAHITITHAVDHGVHISPPTEGVDVLNPVLYGVHLIDHGEQFLKVNPLGTATGYVDNGRVECSRFLLTEAGRPHIERSTGGCYTGGIDVHAGKDWVVRNNRFEGIYCAGEGLAEHAIHFWKRSRGTLVENNLIANCARGIGFGMGDSNTGSRMYADAPYGGADLGHIDGIIRNNVITADIPFHDTGIELMQTRQPVVVHNTVVTTQPSGYFSSMDYRWARTSVILRNNLTRRITARDGAQGTVDHNLENTPMAYFASPGALDFHLTAAAVSAIDQGAALAEAGLDMDGAPHTNGLPDLGADER